MAVPSTIQDFKVRLRWVMIALLASSVQLVHPTSVVGCSTTADCSNSQTCCNGYCIDGSNCRGQSCSQSSDCASGESCCEPSGICVDGLSCVGRTCHALAYGTRYCSGGESCCNGKCISGSICIGSSCSTDSDCAYQNVEFCCRGTCSYTSGCVPVSIIVVGSVCGFVLIVGLIAMYFYFCRGRKSELLLVESSARSYGTATSAEWTVSA